MVKEFGKIIGYDSVKLELERLCDYMLSPDKYKKFGIKMSRGVLLSGPPGVGKTLMANCLIEASKRKCFVCRKDKPNGEFVKAIKDTFEQAKANQPSIVFLDDVDKFANERGLNSNAEEYVTIQSCIDDCKESEVFVVATANEDGVLPESLKRAGRFDKIIEIDCPVGKEAEDIVKYYLDKKSFVSKVDYKLIARILDGRSCAQLESVINEAGFYAGYDGRDMIEMDDFVKAALRVIFRAPESLKQDELCVIERTAYHEAGHAVINEILNDNSVTLVSVCKYDGKIEGVASTVMQDDYFTFKKRREEKVITLLGGKAATEVKFGESDIGCNNDMHRVFTIVERLADHFCTRGFNMFEFHTRSSDGLLSRREDFIFAEIERYYQIAKKILIDNREFLDKIAAELVEKKTLVLPDIQRIKATCKIVPYNI